MSPQLEDLISKLHKKGLTEEQMYSQLQQSNKINEPFTLTDIYAYLAKERTAYSAINRTKPSRAIGRRILGVCLLGLSIFVQTEIYDPTMMRSGKVGGYSLLLGSLSLLLIFKPHTKIDD